MSKVLTPAITSDPPLIIGLSFAADVMRQNHQFILLLWQTVTSYTLACLIESEEHSVLRDGLIRLCIGLIPLDRPVAIIPTDPAPGFCKLVQDSIHNDHRFTIELGNVKKNINKIPVAEKAIQKLQDELLKLDRDRSTISESHLTVALAHLNSCL